MKNIFFGKSIDDAEEHAELAQEIETLKSKVQSQSDQLAELRRDLEKNKVVPTRLSFPHFETVEEFLERQPISVPNLLSELRLLEHAFGLEMKTTPAKTEFVKIKK
jgi:hypothetical protein